MHAGDMRSERTSALEPYASDLVYEELEHFWTLGYRVRELIA